MSLSCLPVAGIWHRARFSCNGEPVDLEVAPDASLLTVLREQLGIVSAKDGCAPQGQCGCCTVLVDGSPRVACVTPVARVENRVVTTLEGLDAEVRDPLVEAFVASGASQCGFCAPGILVRLAGLAADAPVPRRAVDRALAAHLCRCTGWQSIYEAIDAEGSRAPGASPPRAEDGAAARAALEGGAPQRAGAEVVRGDGGFADDRAPRDALVAVPAPSECAVPTEAAAGRQWVVAESLAQARARAGNVQGRRTTVVPAPPLVLPALPEHGVRLATGWVEPAYLEPDASWCVPGGEPAPPLANGGAFGGKVDSPVAAAARELADRLGRAVRVVYTREDVVRLGPKRPPIAATAVLRGGDVTVEGVVAGPVEPFLAPVTWPYRIRERGRWRSTSLPGPRTSGALRGVGLAERALLVEGALTEAGADRAELVTGPRAAAVLLDTCTMVPSGALAGARVEIADDGTIAAVDVRVAAGDPLDEVVLRSYAIGAAHMALGWVLSEGLSVDATTGEIQDLTIRSFGILRAKDVPPLRIEVVDDDGPARGRSSDAVFAAVAAAAWNAVTRADGARPEAVPARGTRAARALRR